MLQTLNTLAGKISPHNGSDSGRIINNNIIANNNNTYNNNDKCRKSKRKIFDDKALEDESTINPKRMLIIWKFSLETAAVGDFKEAKRLSRIKNKRNTSNHSRRYNTSKMESFMNHLNIGDNHKIVFKNEGMLCFDGTDENVPEDHKQNESITSVESTGQPVENRPSSVSSEGDSRENLDEAPNTETVKTPTSAQSQEASSYQMTAPYTMSDLLSKNPKGSISDLKDNMKVKLYGKIYNEEYILTKIADYTDLEKKKKEAIEKQRQIINRIAVKRKKKPLTVRKYFYIPRKKKPTWKDEIESSASSITELNTEVEEPEEFSTEMKVEYSSESNALERKEQPSVCEDSDRSISCPSETDSETRCKCSMPYCTCNEYMRFQNYLSKKYEKDKKTVEIEIADQNPKLTEENVDRWDDLCNLDEVSHWSEETILEVSSTSSSSCNIVRKCHCGHCNCGCDEYREYLLYKLYQVTRRRRKRNNRRAEKAETLRKIIEENYEEDEYNRSVREFINEYYIKAEGPENEKPNICACGLYYCECRDFEESPKEQSGTKKRLHVDISEGVVRKTDADQLISRDMSLDDERRKVRFGSEDSTGAQPQNSGASGSILSGSQKTASSKVSVNSPQVNKQGTEAARVSASTSTEAVEAEKLDSEDIYATMSRLLEKSDTILNFNIEDYIDPDKEPEPVASESDASSYGSFDYKKYLVQKDCNCEDYLKYFNYKQKTRRLAEKADPLLKYLRKRLLYVANLTKAEKLLDHTSSDTESPVRVPEMRICEKYNVDIENIERKKKIFKKKKRKLEKKVILDIIKKGSHLYPCECHIPKKRKVHAQVDESFICEECKVHLKSENITIKTKIEPSIALEEMDERDCVLGLARTFPECPICRENVQRIHFIDKVEQKFITDDDELVSPSMMKGSGRDTSASKTDLEEMGKTTTSSVDTKPLGEGDSETKMKQTSKNATASKGKKKKCKKGKPKKKKGKGASGKKKKGAAKKKAGKKKIKKPIQVYFQTEILSDSSEKELDVAISIFDPRVVYKFSDCE